MTIEKDTIPVDEEALPGMIFEIVEEHGVLCGKRRMDLESQAEEKAEAYEKKIDDSFARWYGPSVVPNKNDPLP